MGTCLKLLFCKKKKKSIFNYSILIIQAWQHPFRSKFVRDRAKQLSQLGSPFKLKAKLKIFHEVLYIDIELIFVEISNNFYLFRC
jgi:hypothetical protein